MNVILFYFIISYHTQTNNLNFIVKLINSFNSVCVCVSVFYLLYTSVMLIDFDWQKKNGDQYIFLCNTFKFLMTNKNKLTLIFNRTKKKPEIDPTHSHPYINYLSFVSYINTYIIVYNLETISLKLEQFTVHRQRYVVTFFFKYNQTCTTRTRNKRN